MPQAAFWFAVLPRKPFLREVLVSQAELRRNTRPMVSPALSPAHRARLDEELRVLERARLLVPGRPVPYHAHLRLRTHEGRERDVLLGQGFRAGDAISVIDWRTAPLAEVFFACEEGEEYEVNLGDRRLEGVLLRRTLVSFERGELAELSFPGARLVRRPGEDFRAEPPRRLPRLEPRPVQHRPRSPVDVELDPAQRRVVDLPPKRPVLILGEAGCGKTTVALHRLLRLRQAHRSRNFRAAVLVPTEGLRALVESLLDRLGLEEVDALTYDKFAANKARRVFRDLPRRESESASGGTVGLKRHGALRTVLRKLAAQPASFEGSRLARRADLHALFGDRALMDEVVALAGGTLSAAAAKDVTEHTRIQFGLRADQEFGDFDPESLVTADGRGLDEATPNEDAGTVDVEDYAVLFELERLRAEVRCVKPAPVGTYDCIVLDEAQELAPLELALVGRAVAPGGTLVVAGDAAQQVDESACFEGWEQTMRELSASDHERAVLEVSYRCPPAVTAFAQTLRDDKKTRGHHTGFAPAHGAALADTALGLARFDNECHLAAWLSEALAVLEARDPTAAAAIICRTAMSAGQLARILQHTLNVHLALGGRFHFGAGTQVTCVPEVKGLEFDHVVVPDATAGRYPDAPEPRRSLYVAATRASAQLLLASAGDATPLADSLSAE